MSHFLIEKMRNVDWGKTIATLSIKILDNYSKPIITLHDCKLVDGAKGMFVSPPSKKLEKPMIDKNDNEKHYLDLAFIHFDHRDELNKEVAQMYDPSGNYPDSKPQKTAPVDINTASTQLAGMPE